MKKLRLNLDMLRVESFSTQHAADRADGTVHGHNDPPYTSDCPSQMIGCTGNYCNDSSGCGSGGNEPPPSMWSCDARCQVEN
jgi:hypothetical protein